MEKWLTYNDLTKLVERGVDDCWFSVEDDEIVKCTVILEVVDSLSNGQLLSVLASNPTLLWDGPKQVCEEVPNSLEEFIKATLIEVLMQELNMWFYVKMVAKNQVDKEMYREQAV